MELADDDVVVRGGLMREIADLVDTVKDSFALEGVHNLSFWGGPDQDVRATCVRSAHGLPHSKIRTARVGDLRAAGFEVQASIEPGHYSVILPGLNLADELAEVVACMTEPETNPTRLT